MMVRTFVRVVPGIVTGVVELEEHLGRAWLREGVPWRGIDWRERVGDINLRDVP